MTLWMENLQRLVALVEERLAEVNTGAGQFSHADYFNWRARRNAAMEAMMASLIEEEQARFIMPGGDNHTVHMAGIRSTSTTGWENALRNWATAAKKRLPADDGFNPLGSGPDPHEFEPRDTP